MQELQTGRYEITSYGGTDVRAFIPDPLPPVRRLQMEKIQQLLDSALVAIGQLDGISVLLPDPSLYLATYISKESVLSSRIEGTVSTLSDVLLFELGQFDKKSQSDDLIEVTNYTKALEHGLKRMRDDDFPLSNRLIREVHEILLQSGRGSKKSPGEFRRSQNWIEGTHPDNAHFVPPPADRVTAYMSELEEFIHSNDCAYSSLIKVGLTHAQFETIHPFLDGNGRIGRLLITLQLHHEGLLTQPFLYISLYINKHRDQYYRRLDQVRSDGDWEQWLAFFLTAVLETSKDAVSVARKLSNLFREDEEKIRKISGNRGSAVQIHQAFQKRPFLTLNRAAQFTGLTFPAASNGVKSLERLKVVREVTGKKRNRVYVYSKYIDILTDNSEY